MIAGLETELYTISDPARLRITLIGVDPTGIAMPQPATREITLLKDSVVVVSF